MVRAAHLLEENETTVGVQDAVSVLEGGLGIVYAAQGSRKHKGVESFGCKRQSLAQTTNPVDNALR